MKRKLALVLAGVMAVSMLPMNLFASTTNRLSNSLANVGEDVVLAQAEMPKAVADERGYKVGTNLTIEPTGRDDILAGETITLTLKNADWNFINSGSAVDMDAADLAEIVNNAVAVNDLFGLAAPATVKDGQTFVQGAWLTGSGQVKSGWEGVYIPSYSALSSLTAFEGEAPYVMGIRNDGITADVLFTTDVAVGTSVKIPLVCVVDAEDVDVTVTITVPRNSKVTPNVYTIVSAATGSTTASFADKKTARDYLELFDLTIRETRVGTIKVESGKFTLTAPDGYKFRDTESLGDKYPIEVATAYAVGFVTAPTISAKYNNGMRTIDVVLSGGEKSTDIMGDIVFTGLQVAPISENTWGPVENFRITNVNAGIASQTIASVGTRVEFNVTLAQYKSTDEIPTIFTGRWHDQYAASLVNAADNEKSKTVQVKFSETLADSWWNGRGTTFDFGEGVIVRGVKITDPTNLAVKLDGEYHLDKADNDGYSTDSYVRFQDGKLTFTSKVYGVKTKKASMRMDFYLSVSQTRADSDIEVVMTGAGLTDEATPLVVAKAVSPIKVETVVTDVKLASVPVATSDIVIKETAKAALLYDKDVSISLTDIYGADVSSDIIFAQNNDTKATVTEGDLQIKDFRVLTGTSGGKMEFFIKSESMKPSTVTISNVSIKANRRLPEFDRYVFDIRVNGEAVVQNYEGNTKTAYSSQFTNIESDGVAVAYARIAGGENVVSEEFSLSVAEGTTTYKLGNKTYDLDPSMIAYNKNGTVYVSLRLLGESLLKHINSEPVHWNESNRTVVLDLLNNQKATFPVGAKYYTVAGVQFDMVDDAGNLVATEIVNDRTFVPLRQVCYAMGITREYISWDQATQTVTVNPQE